MNVSNKGVQNETFIFDSPSAQESGMFVFNVLEVYLKQHALGTLGVHVTSSAWLETLRQTPHGCNYFLTSMF